MAVDRAQLLDPPVLQPREALRRTELSAEGTVLTPKINQGRWQSRSALRQRLLVNFDPD